MMILVLPRDEEMVRCLYHPNKDVRKFVDMETQIEWPLDQFTIRRISNGDIRQVGVVPQSSLPQKRNPPLKFRRSR